MMPIERKNTVESPLWLLGAALIACAALAARLHNACAYPPLADFDAQGHALNVYALFEGTLPHPRSWSGIHPPAYYALGALLWRTLPDSIPVHATLRLVSAGSGVLTAWIIWRVLRRFLAPADAAIATVLGLCIPVSALAGSMIGNEMMSTLLITALLARLTAMRPSGGNAGRQAFGTGLVAGVALLTKSTALIAVGAAAIHYAVRMRARPRSLAIALAILVATPLLIAAPPYARLLAATHGSLDAVVTAAAASPDVRAVMEQQPPGRRDLRDYLSLPLSTFVEPFYTGPGMVRSVPGLLYASAWADAHGHFFCSAALVTVAAQALLAILGLVPTALVALGLARILRRPRRHADWIGPLVFSAALFVSLLGYTWRLPTYSAVKASYLLPALLPLSYTLCVGIGAVGGRARGALRLTLLLIAALATAITWYGWWL